MEIHSIAPVYDENSRILILGSFPSVRSRKERFFYSHPRNRFWKVLAEVYDEEEPKSINEKKEFLLLRGIALWDVVESCEIEGSADSSIRNVKVNDVERILRESKIKRVFTNGTTAEKLYKKHLEEEIGIKSVVLPSTSPANAAADIVRLCKMWSIIREEE